MTHTGPTAVVTVRRETALPTIEIVVPYTTADVTAETVQRAPALAAGLNATLKLIAIYVVPFPADLACPAAMQEHLAARLTEVAAQSSLPCTLQVVVARDYTTGFRTALPPASTVLLGSHTRLWRTREEKFARELTREGHHVSLIHFG